MYGKAQKEGQARRTARIITFFLAFGEKAEDDSLKRIHFLLDRKRIAGLVPLKPVIYMNLEKRSVLLATIFLYLVLPSKGQSPYISHIPEYRPAPGQHINDPLTGTPGAASLLAGGISTPVSLGAYGGYIIFGFDHTIENDPHNPYGIDFTIFGNAFQGSSEPGIVRVMKDENGNGLPDDTWYEIAGSRHYAGNLMPHYRITYFNTASQDSGDILWTDNLNDSGYISRNEFHNQPLYPAQ